MTTNTVQAARTLRETRRRLLSEFQAVDPDVRRAGTDQLRHFHGGRKAGLRAALRVLDQLMAENARIVQESRRTAVGVVRSA